MLEGAAVVDKGIEDVAEGLPICSTTNWVISANAFRRFALDKPPSSSAFLFLPCPVKVFFPFSLSVACLSSAAASLSFW